SGNPFAVYVIIKPTTNTVKPWMFTTSYFMPFTGHISVKMLVVAPSFSDNATTSCLITSE
ncbi:hypothetical protein Q6292_29950, partial [Klebsiella pneumoniae]